MGNHLEAKFAAVGARSRRLLIDAAACFVATSLIALMPQPWKNGEALKEMAFTTDPVSGKIIDRLLSADAEQNSVERAAAAPTPAVFAVLPQERISDWSMKVGAEKIETIPAKPSKAVALRKATGDKRNPVESTPPVLPTANAEPPASAQLMGADAEHQDRGFLARLDPTGLPSKLAPLGQKAWNGATSLTAAVSSFVSAYRF